MSPRSEELWESAKDRLALASLALAAGHEEGAVSAAYYAMLYAARAALSEDERNAKTHAGTWNLFRERFVIAGRFDGDVFQAAHAIQARREAADYDAEQIPATEAADAVEVAERFVAAVGEMLDVAG
jgi:uncharacterized protein (UPF0332 family)